MQYQGKEVKKKIKKWLFHLGTVVNWYLWEREELGIGAVSHVSKAPTGIYS